MWGRGSALEPGDHCVVGWLEMGITGVWQQCDCHTAGYSPQQKLWVRHTHPAPSQGQGLHLPWPVPAPGAMALGMWGALAW